MIHPKKTSPGLSEISGGHREPSGCPGGSSGTGLFREGRGCGLALPALPGASRFSRIRESCWEGDLWLPFLIGQKNPETWREKSCDLGHSRGFWVGVPRFFWGEHSQVSFGDGHSHFFRGVDFPGVFFRVHIPSFSGVGIPGVFLGWAFPGFFFWREHSQYFQMDIPVFGG